MNAEVKIHLHDNTGVTVEISSTGHENEHGSSLAASVSKMALQLFVEIKGGAK
jgi:hypothetical protein